MSDARFLRDTGACGCCDDGVVEATIYNAPGLSEIGCRIGIHPDFLARMKSRIHAWEILTCATCDERFAGPDRLQRILIHIANAHPAEANPADLVQAFRPLARLGSREADDPAIALMDAWAVVGDILTFYQERHANEHYLRTATERRSILELARSIGYELDPGVAAETYLAFRVDDAEGAPHAADVPVGTQLMSIPAGTDELPQTFETVEALTAHVHWNDLRPRMRIPQSLHPDLAHVFLAGTATGLKAGGVAVIRTATSTEARRIKAVTSDSDERRTKVELKGNSAAHLPPAAFYDPETLDPDEPRLPLTRANVASNVFGKMWKEVDLQAYLSLQEWKPESVLDFIDDLREESFRTADQEFLAFRDHVGFFGSNAPRYASLPDVDPPETRDLISVLRSGGPVTEGVMERFRTAGPTKSWPHDWDGIGLSIWKDSLTNDYYDAPSTESFHVFLERAVTGIEDGSWAVFERPIDEFAVYRIADAAEASRTGFGISSRATGLRLNTASGDELTNADRSSNFHFRRSSAHVRSESLELAAVPILDDLVQGTTQLQLSTMVLGLTPGHVIALTGEEVGSDGATRSELLTLEAIVHHDGYTTLTFESGLTRSYVRSSVSIDANVVRASHGETVAEEVLGSGDGSAAHQRFVLKKPPLTHLSAVGGSESTLSVRVDGVEWTQVDSLYGRDEKERVYTVRIDDDANATVIFGDGRAGARLPTGQENVRATYRSGIGSDGIVGSDAITLLKTRPFGVQSVTNPLPSAGADDPEVLDDARTNAPLTVLTLDRIVSLRDYEDYARAYPGIGKARADAIWNGDQEIVHLTVADAAGQPVVEPLLGRLLASIELARDPLPPIVVDAFDPYLFFLKAKVLIDPAYVWDDVAEAVTERLQAQFSFERRGFAQPVSAAEVARVMHDEAGVIAVDIDELYRTTPDLAPSGSLFHSVLEARPARFDAESREIHPAELLLIHTLGIDLSPIPS